MNARIFFDRIASNAMRRGLTRRRAQTRANPPERLSAFLLQHERLRETASYLHREGLTIDESVVWLGMAAGLNGWSYTTSELRELASEAARE